MSILITGTGTLVGNTLAHKLQSSKNVIYATYYKSYPKNLYNKKNIKLNKMNIEKPTLKNNDITSIIHCASAIPDYQFSNKKYETVNFEGFKKMLSNFSNLKHVILMSTISIYGKINTKTINEKTKINKSVGYGKSKYLMEKFLIKDSKKNNYNYTILRLAAVLGKNSKHNFLSNFILDLKKNKKYFSFNNRKMLFNNCIHTETISKVVSYVIKKKIYGIYLLGTVKPQKLGLILNLAKKYKKNIILNYKEDNMGFNINVKKALSKKMPLITTLKTINKFLKENMIVKKY